MHSIEKNRFSSLIGFMGFMVSCDFTSYQTLEYNNDQKILYVLNKDYVIDSISFENETIFSLSLIDKEKGKSKLSLPNLNTEEYKIYKNDLENLSCDWFGGIVFIRKKGLDKNITEEIASQKLYYQEIQKFFIGVNPCSDTIIKSEAVRRLK